MIFAVLSSHDLCCLLHLPVLTRRTTISARDHLCLPQRRPCSVFPDAAARSSPRRCSVFSHPVLILQAYAIALVFL
ncbi:hypothetical protein HID58_014710 [Brassica napus]|uniref:Uncharacterized protein n=1 Tax=Brassica napus TaxID=3708 RepID=A0ABQ8DIF0_BRANA|nr:hypothetical protein HID58_014710 [Brassica napus]